MKVSNVGKLMMVAVSVGSTAYGSDKEVFKNVSDVYSANAQKASFSCGTGSYGYKGSDGLTSYQASKKSLDEVAAQYPNYPWSEILTVASEIRDSDLAVSAGTSCSEYVYNTSKVVIATVASNVSECQEAVADGAIDLKACLLKLSCETIGAQSSVCE